MKKFSKIIFILFVVFLMIVPKALEAKNSRVTDETEELTETELSELNQLADKLSEQHQADICVAIVNGTRGYSIDVYANQIYEDYGYGIGDNYDGILLTVDMDTRRYYMTTDINGKCFNYITDYSIENLGALFVDYYSTYDLYSAIEAWINKVDELLTSAEQGKIIDIELESIDFIIQDSEGNYVDATFDVYDSNGDFYTYVSCYGGKGVADIAAGQQYTAVFNSVEKGYDLPTNIVFNVKSSPVKVTVEKSKANLGLTTGVAGGSGLVAALVYTGILKGKNKSVRKKYDATTYLRRGSFYLNDQRDMFLYSQISKTPKPKNNSSSGSSGGGSGGSSFSGSVGSRSGGRGGGSF